MPSPFAKPPLYVVPFTPGAAEGRAQDQSPHAPVVFERPEASESTVPHGLAKTVAAALPGLWYCLHLPASLPDLIDVDIWMLKAAQNLRLEHSILMVPIDCFEEDVLGEHLQRHHPVVTICPDDLLDEARQRASALGFALPTIPYSQLSDATLAAQWQAIHEHFIPDLPRLAGEVTLTHRLDLAPLTLPHRRLARQMGWPTAESVTQDTSAGEAFGQALRGQRCLATWARLEREGASHDEADRRFRRTFKEEAGRLRVPVALGLPGTAPAYARMAYDSEIRRRTKPQPAVSPDDTWSVTLHERSDHLVERAAIEFAVTHQSVASSGLGLMLPTVPPDAFTTLAEIERHFHTPHSSAAVRRLLTRLNDAAQPLWSEELKAAIQCASYLAVYSDFPLGLLTMPGDSAPLCTRLPVTYRPMQPLTRMVQQQLSAAPAVSLDRSITVLVAECIPVSDPVGRISRQGWDIACEASAPDSTTLTITQAETLTLEALQRAVTENRPDVLIISAHGTMVGNMAALVIGDKPYVDLGLDRMPPVVILSACHVAPRGSGAVAITDLLLREGALAVLGTQVPVDVRRNAMLMVRFMVYLAKENTRPGQFSTILDVWHHVQTSNAVNDILDGSPSLRAWATHTTINDRSVLVEFMSSRATGRIRSPHVYEDTERVLGEIADEQGQGERVRNWFRRPGYVPESLFYVFTGRPDRIHLTPLGLLVEQARPGR